MPRPEVPDALMSCPCGRGDYELCGSCPYDFCSVHGAGRPENDPVFAGVKPVVTL
jgi:hypothetical protein